jgi:hypothetical protein
MHEAVDISQRGHVKVSHAELGCARWGPPDRLKPNLPEKPSCREILPILKPTIIFPPDSLIVLLSLKASVSEIWRRFCLRSVNKKGPGRFFTPNRIPITWNHVIDKGITQIHRVGACPKRESREFF